MIGWIVIAILHVAFFVYAAKKDGIKKAVEMYLTVVFVALLLLFIMALLFAMAEKFIEG